MAEQEGVIKYQAEQKAGQVVCGVQQLHTLNAQRERLKEAAVLGQDPARYEGLGFGNMSWRNHRSTLDFFITATQTGALPVLNDKHLAHVQMASWQDNYLAYCGESAPSSEALSHAALYECAPTVMAVVHVHAPDIWYHAAALGLALTPEDLQYGTPAMARALQTAWQDQRLAGNGPVVVIAMGGHEDGVIACGPDLTSVTDRLLDLQDSVRQLASK